MLCFVVLDFYGLWPSEDLLAMFLPCTPGIRMLSLPQHRLPVLVGSCYLVVSRGSYCQSLRLPRTNRSYRSSGCTVIYSRGPCCSLQLPRPLRSFVSRGLTATDSCYDFHVASCRFRLTRTLVQLIHSSGRCGAWYHTAIHCSSQKHGMFRTLVILADLLLSTLALAALLQAQWLGPSS
jgi:hypothetical protein